MGKASNKFWNANTASREQRNEINDNNGSLRKIYAVIDQLHQMDLAATRIHNTDMMVTLFTEDCIMLPPALGPICGRDAIRDYLNNKFMEWKTYEVAQYDQQFEEVRVFGELAYEWGTSKGVFYMKGGGPDIFENSRLFRILRSQPDGSWKIARVMWHDVP